jgi:hypothetical protein
MISTVPGASLIPTTPKALFNPKVPNLQSYDWPASKNFSELTESLEKFLTLSKLDQIKQLSESKKNLEEHGKFVNECLTQIYAYIYGYPNGISYLAIDDELEIKLQQAKILLEKELIQWLNIPSIPQKLNQLEAAEYLAEFIHQNTGVFHELYDFIATKASKKAVLTFLFTETVRTEVVDDEVAFMTVGLQGPLKRVSTSNLWDECGKGEFTEFHTYWLRMLLEQLQAWSQFSDYREKEMPWFTTLVSNAFNVLLTRPGYKYAAYGHFSVGESWVPPHFLRILEAMKRVGFSHSDEVIYFEKHVNIDTYHTQDLLDGIAHQKPELTQREIDQILFGAHQMVAASTMQYKRMLSYLSSL